MTALLMAIVKGYVNVTTVSPCAIAIKDSCQEMPEACLYSYEQTVRLTATVRRDLLGGNELHAKCDRIPLDTTEYFIFRRVYDTLISDDHGANRDSVLQNDVEWDLCSSCTLKR